MRFSLKWMLAAVAFVGYGCVALYNANEAWAMASFGLTAVVLLAAVVGSIHSNSRAFYTGMAVFGWGYLILNYVPPIREGVRAVGPLAAVDVLLDIIRGRVLREVPLSAEEIDRHKIHQSSAPSTKRIPVPFHFETVGHSLFALLFAIIGGAVGQCFSRGAKCKSV